ncbi:XRE family transcriptional regulator [Nitrospina watsonii]|uniref:HTH cro/C1-type domain-containing protein n=1 Tax=Nitrospina watsonii TaxID=1323948 RepID=A0ABN8W166_9BACT|nr:XRE family transcriptional regulator [Nitrospina watsonii]CAI2719734.1 HTH cro/C1-type domain-containing protein [Nitrospina watsonii]
MNKVLKRIEALQNSETLTRFCQDTGVNYEKLKKSFQRDTLPDSETLAQIANFFRLDLQWLVSGQAGASRLHTRISRNLKECRTTKGWSVEDLAQRIGIPGHVLDQYEKGKCTVSLDLIQDVARKLKIDARMLLSEDRMLTVQVPDLKVFQTANTPAAPKIANEDYISIPLTDSSIAAGHPIIQENNIEDYVLLHIRAAGKRTNLVASRVDGDSMEPMLSSGDIVVIDRNDKKIVKNKIYAIFYEDGLTAKYLERKKHLLILRPINPTSDVQIIDMYENPDPIVGRVIGAWKEL